jgi:signal transduction histidine kinase
MILIVDDKQLNLFSLKRILEVNNFEVDTASSGEEALKKILKNTYALVILDVQMPGMDGFEVAEIINGYSKTKDLSIIFLSAVNTDKRFIQKGYASGAVDYITKPVDPDILLLKVKVFYRLFEQAQELNRIHETLREEIEFRKLAEKKKDEFISIASHELKTPLTSIKAYTQLLERSAEDDNVENRKKFIQRTLAQVDKLHGLITDLLDMSKIENGKLVLNKRIFDFGQLLRNTMDIVQQTNPQAILEHEGDATVQVYGDDVRIEQVLINYLTNAIKYSPDSRKVLIRTLTEGDSLLVEVVDQGVGIPKEKQAQIFDKFYRAEETSNRFQGLGIGLYICSEIVRRHNGSFGVMSEPGRGSTFYFSIPLLLANIETMKTA